MSNISEKDNRLLLPLIALNMGYVDERTFIALVSSIITGGDEGGVESLLMELGSLSETKISILTQMKKQLLKKHGDDSTAAIQALIQNLVEEMDARTGEHDTRIEMTDAKETRGIEDDSFLTRLSPESTGDRALNTLNDAVKVSREQEGRYIMKGEFGRGGIGRVMLAFDTHLGREIAIKELLPAFAGREKDTHLSSAKLTSVPVVRFLQEARVTGQLEHPGIVPVYELGQRQDGTLYYTMKLVRGNTLRKRVSEATSLQERLGLLPHFLDICQTLAYAHHRGVIHRDLKPDNIMIGEFGETVVLDWGLAKVKGVEDRRAEKLAPEASETWGSSGMTISGSAIGTPAFMPPEQAHGEVDKIDERSDVWSLGVILYNILSGRLPFDARTAREMIRKVQQEEPIPLQLVAKDAPPELVAVVHKCLCRKPGERYQSAAALADEIQKFQTGGLISAYSYSPFMLLKRWMNRHKAVTFTVLMSLLFMTSGAFWSYLMITRQRDHAIVAKKLAQQKELETRVSLAQALAVRAQAAVEDSRWPEARIYYAGVLHYVKSLSSWFSLALEEQQPMRLKKMTVLGKHDGNAVALAVSPDETHAVSGGMHGEMFFWDLRRARKIGTIKPFNSWVSGLAYSPDGSIVAGTESDQHFCLIETKSLKILKKGEIPMHLRCLTLTPDGKALVIGRGDGKVSLVRVPEGTLMREKKTHENRVTTITFNRSGSIMATVSEDGKAKLWKFPSLEPIATLPGTRGWISSADFSPDDRTLIIGSSTNFVQGYDVASKQELFKLPGHSGEIFSLHYSSDGKFIYSGSFDTTIRVWDAERRVSLLTLTGHQAGVFRVLPVGENILSVSQDGSVRKWDLQFHTRNEVNAGVDEGIRALDYDEREHIFVVGGRKGTIAIYDYRKHRLLKKWQSEQGLLTIVKFVTLCVEHEGIVEKLLISVGRTHTLKVWNWKKGTIVRLLNIKNNLISSVAVHPSGRWIALATEGGMYIWDVLNDQLSQLHPSLPGSRVIFTSENELLFLSSGDKNFIRYSFPQGDEIARFAFGTSYIFDAVLSPDGRLLAVSFEDQTIRIFDWPHKRLVKIIREHNGEINSIVFSADGRYLISGSYDAHVRIFDTRHWSLLVTIPTDKLPVRSNVLFIEESQQIAWGMNKGRIYCYTLPDEGERKNPEKLLRTFENQLGFQLVQSRLVPTEVYRIDQALAGQPIPVRE